MIDSAQSLSRQVEEESMERAMFEIPSTFDFYNKLCHDRCEGSTELLPFLNACPQCPDHYESAHCNKCCQGGASSIKMRWHGCAATLTFASSEKLWEDCGVETPFEHRPRFVDCDCYDTLLDPVNFDAFGCVLYETINIPRDSTDSTVCIVSTKYATFGRQVDADILAIDFSTPLPAVLGLINEVEVPVGANEARMKFLATYFDTTCIVADEDSPFVLPIFPGYGKFPNTCHDFGFIDLQNGNPPLPDSIEHFVGNPPREADWYEFIDGTSIAFWPTTRDGEAIYFEPSFATCQCSKCYLEVDSIPPSQAITQPPNEVPSPTLPTLPGRPQALPSSGPTLTQYPAIATVLPSTAPTLPRRPGPPRPGTATSTAPTSPRRPGIATTLPSAGPTSPRRPGTATSSAPTFPRRPGNATILPSPRPTSPRRPGTASSSAPTLPRRPGIATTLPSPVPTSPRRPGTVTAQPTTAPTLTRRPETGTALPSTTPTLPRRPGPHRRTLMPSILTSLIPTDDPSYPIRPNSPSLSPTTAIALSTTAPSTWPTVSGLPKPIPQTLLPSVFSSFAPIDPSSDGVATDVPSQSSSRAISFSPSTQPSSEQITRQTFSPSTHSSLIPSDSSSFMMATDAPSQSPNVMISLWPTQPSSDPTTRQTFSPSTHSSSIPSDGPTDAPSQSPSIAISLWPSTPPSSEPTTRQTISPTPHSSSIPSDGPTDVPSQSPSTAISLWPSTQPSSEPMTRLTFLPSSHSSSIPSDGPSFTLATDVPSQSPSVVKASWETTEPSPNPTIRTTLVPSIHSSSVSTNNPSYILKTNAPSQSPSGLMVSTQTRAPSPGPTFPHRPGPIRKTPAPSLHHSQFPTDSTSHTTAPSDPSQSPSAAIAPHPMIIPSSAPSLLMTMKPSLQNPLIFTDFPSFNAVVTEPSQSPTLVIIPWRTTDPSSGQIFAPSVHSIHPSLHPSNAPSYRVAPPSPSGAIAASPTKGPSPEPTIPRRPGPVRKTVVPSISTSPVPTNAPSYTPATDLPSQVPSLITVSSPTTKPLCEPTIPRRPGPMRKTLEPSSQQSLSPSGVNSVLQGSASPTVSPSDAVSLVPSPETSNIPTAFNSVVSSTTIPTASPTVEDTGVSSFGPTFGADIKTVSPMLDPSGTPSTSDSIVPSIEVTNTDLPTQQGKCAPQDFSTCNSYASSWCRFVSAPTALGSKSECRFEDAGTKGRSLQGAGGLQIRHGVTKKEILATLTYHQMRLAFLRVNSH
jgi:hypothetical protein